MIELEGISCEEQLRSLILSSLQRRRVRGGLIALYTFLRRQMRDVGANLFSFVISDRMCGNGSKLAKERFRLGEVLNASGLYTLKTHLDYLNNMF